jgi:hypothetical protein
MKKHLRLLAVVCAFGALAAPAAADNSTSGFATNDTGCLGGLRSAIARGDLAGVTLPDGFVVPAGFGAEFNPGGHLGTVGEEAFLRSHGVTDLDAFCALFVK